MNILLKEYRCPFCKKLFFMGNISYATIEIKCKNCKNINLIKNSDFKPLPATDEHGTLKEVTVHKRVDNTVKSIKK